MPETIRIRYDGGIADNGQIHFYEYSRSQYALSRFISTIEYFRRTGEVADRISGRRYVELVISTPTRGSFLQDITLTGIAEGVIGTFVATPFLALFSYVWQLLVPRRDTTSDELTQLLRARTALERERTSQIKARSELIGRLHTLTDGTELSAQEATELLRWATNPLSYVPRISETTAAERVDMFHETESEREREAEFAEYLEQLSEVDEDTYNRLTSRLRPMVPEMALPLRRSATRMSMGGTEPGRQELAHITWDIVDLIQTRTTESAVTRVEGRIKSYDRDNGIGKVQSDEFSRVLNFIVRPNDRDRLRDVILAAMRRDLVTLVCRRVLDDSGKPTSIILINIEFE